MKRVLLIIGICISVVSCDNSVVGGDERFTGVISEYENDRFNFFGYQLKDVVGFERHQFIDTVYLTLNDTITIRDYCKLVVDSNWVYVMEAENVSIPFTNIVNKGSTIVTPTYFSDGHPYTMLSGAKNGRLWFGKFDRATKEQLQEWNDDKDIDRNFNQVLSSKLTQFRIQDFYVSNIYKLRNGYGVSLSTRNSKVDYDIASYILTDDRLINVPFEMSNGGYLGIFDWYKMSYLQTQFNVDSKEYYYTIATNQGEVSETFTSKDFPVGYPINYHEWLSVSLMDGSLIRKNFDGNIAWEVQVEELISVNYNQSTFALINNDTDIWEFTANIVNSDNSQKIVKLKLNINTGKVELIG